jgi:3-oxoacyl-[acyl-carrier protein] reductase
VDLQLSGKVAMVAASSRGLGRACAVGLAREGVTLSLAARSAEALAALADEILDACRDDILARLPDAPAA